MRRKIDFEAATSICTSPRSVTRRNTLKGGLALGAGFTASTFAIIGRASAAPITMRFASDSPINAPHTKSALAMKERVEKDTSGRVRVTIYPDSQLGGGAATANSVKTGSLDAVVIAVEIVSTAVPEVDVFSLPFLFHDPVQAVRVANGPFGAKLATKVNRAFNCEVGGYATDGVHELYTKDHPVGAPKDMASLKVGVATSQIQRDTVLALGGIPTVIGIEATYTGLQTGLIRATLKTRPDAIEFKIYQVVKYLTLASFFSQPNVLLVSRKFLDKLTPHDREVVRSAGLPACEAQTEAVLAFEKTALAFLTSHGIETVKVDNLEAFRDKVSSVYKETEARIGANLVAEARKLATI